MVLSALDGALQRRKNCRHLDALMARAFRLFLGYWGLGNFDDAGIWGRRIAEALLVEIVQVCGFELLELMLVIVWYFLFLSLVQQFVTLHYCH